jgi:hypothetical protein
VRAQCIDDEIVFSERALIRGEKLDTVRLNASASNLGVMRDVNVFAFDLTIENVEQRGAMNRQRRCVRSERIVANIEHDAIRWHRAAAQSFDGRTQRQNRGQYIEFLQNRKPGRLENQSRSERPRLLELIEKANFVSGSMQ